MCKDKYSMCETSLSDSRCKIKIQDERLRFKLKIKIKDLEYMPTSAQERQGVCRKRVLDAAIAAPMSTRKKKEWK